MDAVTGGEIYRKSRVARGCTQESFEVFPVTARGFEPVESPAHGSQNLVSDPADSTASPSGWVSPQDPCVLSWGNNVLAFENILGGQHFAGRSESGACTAPGCTFDYPDLDLASLEANTDLASYHDAAITNLFYTANAFHDVLYLYGFNETAGNFQEDNFGRGGVGGDPVEARRNEVQGNGFCTVAPEGSSPVIKMGSTRIPPAALTLYTAPAGAAGASGLAPGDFDGDGDIDLAMANASSSNLTVFKNDGAAAFPPGLSQNYPLPCAGPVAVVPLDLDGKSGLDLAVACGDGKVVLLKNSGSGGFSAAQTLDLSAPGASEPRALARADLDGDGDPDLAVANKGFGYLSLYEQTAIREFRETRRVLVRDGPLGVIAQESLAGGTTRPMNLNPSSIEDPEGLWADLAAVSATSFSVRVNRGHGTPWLFTAPRDQSNGRVMRGDHPLGLTSGSARGLVAADLDGDGRADLAIPVDSSPSSLVVARNADREGYGTFQDTATSTPWVSVRDGSLDNGFVVHELAHCAINRLAGGAGNREEGWSDFFAMVFTQTSESERPRGVFQFSRGELPGDPGERSLPYTRDLLMNPLTFGDYNFRRCFAGNPPCDYCFDPTACGRDKFIQTGHALAEIWAAVLWDLYWALCDEGVHGRSNNLYLSAFGPAAGGENVALQLAVDALKLQPPGKGFLGSRDAFLLADQADFGGAHTQLIWDVFARRGMGWDSCEIEDVDPVQGTESPCLREGVLYAEKVVEDFTTPPEGSICGYVFEDLDCDGVRDPGEPDLEGWVVFLDDNKNGLYDNGETYLYTGGGLYYWYSYCFFYLEPGEYTVAVLRPPGWVQTTPGDGEFRTVARWNGTPGSLQYADVWANGRYAYLGHNANLGVDIIDLGLLEAQMRSDPGCLTGPGGPGCAQPAWAAHWEDAGGRRQEPHQGREGPGRGGLLRERQPRRRGVHRGPVGSKVPRDARDHRVGPKRAREGTQRLGGGEPPLPGR